MEDPFDATDNAGRTVDNHGLNQIAERMATAARLIVEVDMGWGDLCKHRQLLTIKF